MANIDKQLKIKQMADSIRSVCKSDLNHICNNDLWNIAEAVKRMGATSVMPSLTGFKARRESLSLSLRDVANKTRVSPSTISRIERGSEADYSNVKILHEWYVKNGV